MDVDQTNSEISDVSLVNMEQDDEQNKDWVDLFFLETMPWSDWHSFHHENTSHLKEMEWKPTSRQGTEGQIYTCASLPEYVCKLIKEDEADGVPHAFLMELQFGGTFKHPNLLFPLGWFSKCGVKKNGDLKTCWYIVYEAYHCDLQVFGNRLVNQNGMRSDMNFIPQMNDYDDLLQKKELEESNKIIGWYIRDIVQGLLEGLVAMHEQSHFHFDIKGTNVVLKFEGGVKPKLGSTKKPQLLGVAFCDYGMSSFQKQIQQIANTARFRPKEIGGEDDFALFPFTAINYRQDVFALGCTIQDLILKEWAPITLESRYKLIPLTMKRLSFLLPNFGPIWCKMIHEDPFERPTIEWIRNSFQHLLQPEDRFPRSEYQFLEKEYLLQYHFEKEFHIIESIHDCGWLDLMKIIKQCVSYKGEHFSWAANHCWQNLVSLYGSKTNFEETKSGIFEILLKLSRDPLLEKRITAITNSINLQNVVSTKELNALKRLANKTTAQIFLNEKERKWLKNIPYLTLPPLFETQKDIIFMTFDILSAFVIGLSQYLIANSNPNILAEIVKRLVQFTPSDFVLTSFFLSMKLLKRSCTSYDSMFKTMQIQNQKKAILQLEDIMIPLLSFPIPRFSAARKGAFLFE